MKKLVSTALVLTLVLLTAGVAVPTARAENGRIAAGVAGGILGGVLLGSALSAPPVYAAPPPPPPTYYVPAPAPVYVEEPECRFVREQYWDGYGYRVRRYRVCD